MEAEGGKPPSVGGITRGLESSLDPRLDSFFISSKNTPGAVGA